MKKARKINLDSILGFDELFLVILIGNFDQFTPVQEKAFCGNLIREKNIYKKGLWSRFTSILTLIGQMCQKTDLPFQEIIKKVKEEKLDLQNRQILN